MVRRPRTAVVSPVTWRDGVHLTGTPIWCDARRRRDVCFASSADRMTKSGHGQLIGTPLTLALIGAEPGHLGVPLLRRFTLGTLRLELIASGRGLGSASLFVDIAGRGVLYASAIRSDVPVVPGLAIEPAEVRACDAVVVAAPYADEREFPPLAQTIERVSAWCREVLATGSRPVLLVDSALDGVEVAWTLAARGLPVAAGRAIRDTLKRLASAPETTTPGKEPRVTVWLERDRTGLARALAKYPHAIAVVSGRSGAEYAWPHAAGRAGTLEWIASTGARHVFVTGPGAPKLVAALGARARVIGPPHQMQLFPREASP